MAVAWGPTYSCMGGGRRGDSLTLSVRSTHTSQPRRFKHQLGGGDGGHTSQPLKVTLRHQFKGERGGPNTTQKLRPSVHHTLRFMFRGGKVGHDITQKLRLRWCEPAL